MPRLLIYTFAATFCALLLTECAQPSGSRTGVVTSVSVITNLADNIAGGHIEITGLIPEGADSHTFEPPPADAKIVGASALMILNGMHLDDSVARLAASARRKPKVVRLGTLSAPRSEWIFDETFPADKGDPNPHLWTDPIYAREYAERITDALSEIDPPRQETYRSNHERLARKIDDLDAALKEATATVPEQQRKLLSYHDSFPYFARRYGWTVIGAVQPSDFSEPSPRDVARLIDQIRRENVPAVFGSEVFPSPVLEQVARETGAVYIPSLRDDDLPGEKGAPDHSYLAMMKFDFSTMIRALGGDSRAIDAIDAANIGPERARYRG